MANKKMWTSGIGAILGLFLVGMVLHESTTWTLIGGVAGALIGAMF